MKDNVKKAELLDTIILNAITSAGIPIDRVNDNKGKAINALAKLGINIWDVHYMPGPSKAQIAVYYREQGRMEAFNISV